MRAARRVWVVGPVAWDTVVYVDRYPTPGRFTQCRRTIERPGGSAANVAQAVATAGIETGFVTTIGDDAIGHQLRSTLAASRIAHLVVQSTPGESDHVLVLVDDDGERTILGLSPRTLHHITSRDAPLEPGDIVVFVVWSDHFLADLDRARAHGCTTIVGLGALDNPAVTADIAFGSRSDVIGEVEPAHHLTRFGRVVVTSGPEGALQTDGNGELRQSAIATAVVDTTGAGDAFLAGYLAMYARGFEDGVEALEAGARWAALTVSHEGSIPPEWDEVATE
ncbi:MAG TPA: carbohydrate kinase family protein [Ornithinibacter sp.]|nr:carbohydrate kinase family protein [Ornithinibacter sp.]